MKKCPECHSKIYNDDYLICPYCGLNLVPNSINNVCVNVSEVRTILEQHNIHNQIMPFIYALIGAKNEDNIG